MPDWAYHPFFRPVLFRLPAEAGRRVTIELLALQARLPGGPVLFERLARSRVPEQLRIRFAGVDFPSPVGLAAGIDVDGRAAVLLQKLGLGFVELGPLGALATDVCRETSPVRLREVHGIAMHPHRGAPAASEVLRRLPDLDVPFGVEVRGDDLASVVSCVAERASFITLPCEAHASVAQLRALRAVTDRPLLLKLSAGWDDGRLDAAVARAVDAGIDGAFVVAGAPSHVHREGELISSTALARALEVVARTRTRIPVALSGGVLTPDDGLAAWRAGARLIALSNGMVYAGPGLPQRINRRLAPPPPRVNGNGVPARSPPAAEAVPKPAEVVVPTPAARTPRPAAAATAAASERTGFALLAVAAAGLLLIGAGYLVLAFTAKLLPNDTAHLGMSVAQLCRLDSCRIVDFISHDCAVYGGICLANGTLWMWIARVPLRRREPWAWWTLLAATCVLVVGFLSFLGYGYFDTVHSAILACVVGCAVAGLWLTRRVARGSSPLRALLEGAPAWIWSPAGRGRLLLLGLSMSLVLGGSSIVGIASTRVFVPEDVEFLRMSGNQVRAIDPQLVPVMAHDRAEFGAGLLMFGVLVAATALAGVRPRARGVLIVLGLAGTMHFTATFIAHVQIGYLNFVHLFPIYWGLTVLLLGIALLRRPVLHAKSLDAFPDV
jgi:dihydroorotate dehydrogenase